MNNDWPTIRPRKRKMGLGGAFVEYDDFAIDLGTVNGKRTIYFRTTMKEAEELAASLRRDRKEMGDLCRELTPADKLDAVRAIRILSGKTTLETAAAFYLANHQDKPLKTVLDVQNELLAAQEARRNREDSIQATRTRYATFLTEYGSMQIGVILPANIETWLTEQKFASDTTKANAIRYLSVFFNFAVKRGYIDKSPMANIEKPKVKYTVPEFLAVADVERLMRESEKSDVSLSARLATALFAGLRPTELSRLLPTDIDLAAKVIHVRPEVSKTGRPRHVTISDNLAAWLTRYPFDVSNNFDERRAKVCKAAGIDKWPNDCLRHTFATFHVAAFQKPEQTAFEMGHSKGTAMLDRHYRGLASREDALRFWEITPTEESPDASH